MPTTLSMVSSERDSYKSFTDQNHPLRYKLHNRLAQKQFYKRYDAPNKLNQSCNTEGNKAATRAVEQQQAAAQPRWPRCKYPSILQKTKRRNRSSDMADRCRWMPSTTLLLEQGIAPLGPLTHPTDIRRFVEQLRPHMPNGYLPNRQ